MRNIKVFRADDLTMTDHKNVNAPFPSELPNDIDGDWLEEVVDDGLTPDVVKITKNEVKSKSNLRLSKR